MDANSKPKQDRSETSSMTKMGEGMERENECKCYLKLENSAPWGG